MKKIIIAFVFLLSKFFTAFALEEIEFCVEFSQDEFSIDKGSDGLTCLSTLRYDAFYVSDTTAPAIPKFVVSYAIPANLQYVSHSTQISKQLIVRDAVLKKISPPKSSEFIFEHDNMPLKYSGSSYPEDYCEFLSESEINGVKMLRFEICPFLYEASTKLLYFIDNIKLLLKVESSNVGVLKAKAENVPAAPIDLEFFESLVENPSSLRELSMTDFDSGISFVEKIDYLIVTGSKTYWTFQKLAEWKRKKGVRTKVADYSTIIQYLGKDMHAKHDRSEMIKRYIYEMNLRYGVKYVLLAGDDLDVPVRGCYAYGVNKDSSIPSDLYYGCFGKEFYWDKDGDKVYGEIEDNIDFYPSVYVSRAPIRSVDDAEVFINRTIEYETNPVWNDNILMAGLHLSPAGGADAEIQGNLMYNKAIRPYWDGQLVRMYDTYSDVPSTSYYFTRYMLKTQLAKGYNFASILTHGGPYSWSCDRWEEYDLNYANSQTNSGHTVVTTMSCSTNAFDSYYEDAKDPCLSESLIRNPNSGIIAYFGASRDGFYSTNKQELGSSLSYEAELYKALFSKELKDKNWARVAALAKAKKIGESERQGQYRWLQFALNPIGDAEMPIYTAKPSDFSSANLIEDCSGITIDTQVDSCRICVMSIDDQGASFYKVYNNVQTVNLTSYPDAISICVTKQNYRPLVYEYVSNKNVLPMKRLMNNEELVYDVQYEQTSRIDRIENSNTELVVFTEHANLLQSGEIEVSNLYGAVYFKEEAHHSDVNRVSIDRWNSGIYIVSMKDCGKVVDTKRFVKY